MEEGEKADRSGKCRRGWRKGKGRKREENVGGDRGDGGREKGRQKWEM